MNRTWWLMLAMILAVAIGCREPQPPAPVDAPHAVQQMPLAKQSSGGELEKPEKIAAQHLPNTVRVHEKVYSGGAPHGEEGFAELKALGVKTVISVDGAKPNIELAKKYGLRYVHLPHGYDGIPDERALDLAKAVSDLPGDVYIHCHHGKHRSPAAAAVACVGAGFIASDDARAVLELAGTSENYRGLYESADTIRPIDKKKLAAANSDFPATVEPSAMAEAMVALEHTHDHVKQLAANDWRMISTAPDLDAPHEALLLREHYTEMLRTEEVMAHPKEFRQLLKQGEAAALTLETSLADWAKAGRTEKAPTEAHEALQEVTQNCKTCHQKFRDVPLSEKGGR